VICIIKFSITTPNYFLCATLQLCVSSQGTLNYTHPTKAFGKSADLGHLFTARRNSIARTSYGNVAGWVSVCHSRYCIKMTKPIVKLFQISGSHIIEAFGTLAPIPNSKGNPFIRAFNTRGWEKMEIFNAFCRLSRKRCQIGRWLLWNVNWLVVGTRSTDINFDDLE